jgi:hypothetical protein
VIFWLALVIVMVISISRRLTSARRFVLVMLAGFTGMVTETLLMLNYQSKSGVLYQDIGILLMSFMIGLTLGAFIIDRLLQSRIHHEKLPGRQHLHVIAIGVALLLGFGLLNMAAYYFFRLGLLNGLYSTSVALILDGSFVSATFALVVIRETGDRKGLPIRLYSADLIGGSLGSLIASLFLIPVYGILVASIMMGTLAFCGLVFLR